MIINFIIQPCSKTLNVKRKSKNNLLRLLYSSSESLETWWAWTMFLIFWANLCRCFSDNSHIKPLIKSVVACTILAEGFAFLSTVFTWANVSFKLSCWGAFLLFFLGGSLGKQDSVRLDDVEGTSADKTFAASGGVKPVDDGVRRWSL